MHPDESPLRRALLINAVFSGICAVAIASTARPLAGLLGPVDTVVLYGIAVGLAAFSLSLLRQAHGERVNPSKALVAAALDLAWVLGSAAFVLLYGGSLPPAGRWVVIGVAVLVSILAVSQIVGLKRYARNRAGRTDARSAYALERTLDAPAGRVWDLIRQLDRIGEFYEELHTVEVRETGQGTVRACSLAGGRRWSEEVLELDDRTKSLTLRFMTEAEDFPFPMTAMVGGWKVTPREDRCAVTLWYEYTMKGGVFGEIMAALAAPALERRMGPVLEELGVAARE